MYRYGILDPRPGADNSALLGPDTLGIEVTIPALAAQCGQGNIDPQHEGGDVSKAAIEVAAEMQLPPDGTILITVRPDADSVGAMAVLTARRSGGYPQLLCPNCGTEIEPQFSQCMNCGNVPTSPAESIALMDKASRGEWPGQSPLPSGERMWPEYEGRPRWARPGDEISAASALALDHSLPIEERVRRMRGYLQDGKVPEEYLIRAREERARMVSALEKGEIMTEMVGDRIVVVRSSHMAAFAVGYAMAPVVIAENSEFSFRGGESHRKLTVAQFNPGHVDLRAAVGELAALEQGWGGSPTIVGSPQGVNCDLPTEKVVEIVKRHLM